MSWGKAAVRQGERLENLTTSVPLLKDTWVKAKLILSHMAGLSSLVSTMNTEMAQLRYSYDRLNEQMIAERAESSARWAAVVDRMGWDGN